MEEAPMELHFGRGTVRENLERAVAEGKLKKLQCGNFTTAPKAKSYLHLQVQRTREMQCQFLDDFLFQGAYDQMAVPYGCRNCYKVKIAPTNFKGLIALRGVLEDAPYHSKCGVTFFNPYTQNIYAGNLYLDGLDAARAAYSDLHERIHTHPDLIGSVSMTIKRGCSHMEAKCGPSVEWSFREGMAELETALRKCFIPECVAPVDYRQRRMESMISWLQIAYNIKDDTYLTFTGGKPLHTPTVSYSAEVSTKNTPPPDSEE